MYGTLRVVLGSLLATYCFFFTTNSTQGGEFVLAEQFHFGWTAEIDGSEVPRLAWNNAFVSANVPPGKHSLVFEFKPNWHTGAAISAASMIILIGWIVRSSTTKSRN